MRYRFRSRLDAAEHVVISLDCLKDAVIEKQAEKEGIVPHFTPAGEELFLLLHRIEVDAAYTGRKIWPDWQRFEWQRAAFRRRQFFWPVLLIALPGGKQDHVAKQRRNSIIKFFDIFAKAERLEISFEILIEAWPANKLRKASEIIERFPQEQNTFDILVTPKLGMNSLNCRILSIDRPSKFTSTSYLS